MKKIIAMLLAVMLLASLVACGETATTSADTAASTETAEAVTEETAETEEPAAEEETAEPAAEESTSDVPACTDEEPVINLYGEFTRDSIQEGILLTNVGQSADAATMATLLNKAGAAFDENDSATADDLAGYGTLIVVAGASTKGLGSAGISQDEEMDRTEKLLAAAKDAGMTIILAHLGGSGRRGNISDLFIEKCLPYADYMLVVEDGNTDGYFSDYCSANSIPLTIVKSSKNALSTVTDLFA